MTGANLALPATILSFALVAVMRYLRFGQILPAKEEKGQAGSTANPAVLTSAPAQPREPGAISEQDLLRLLAAVVVALGIPFFLWMHL